MTQTVTSDLKTWRPFKIGAGGFLTGLSQAYDGTLYCRTDTYGAYKWNTGTSDWTQLVTGTSLPGGDIHADFEGGVVEIAAATGSTDSAIVYMIYGAPDFECFVYRSADRGATWIKRTGSVGNYFGAAANGGTASMNANNQANSARLSQKMMAVDPTNPDVIYTSNGVTLKKSTDGGVNWSSCSGFTAPTGSNPAVTGILIDPSSSTLSSPTRKAVIWAFSYGNGYFRSTDGGATWAVVAGGPTFVRDADINANGVLLAVDSSTGKTWRYSSSTWTDLVGTNAWFVAFDPNSVNRAVIASADAQLKEQTNITTGNFSGSWLDGTANKVSTTIPWQAISTEETYMSAGGINFSKSTANRLLMSQGIGFWRTDISAGFTASHTWTSMSVGIEQLVSNQIKKFTGNRYIYYACWDRGLFRTANPEQYAPYANTPASSAANAGIRHVFHLDAAKNDSDFIVALVTYGNASAGCAYSNNGGDTWTIFERPPIPVGIKTLFNVLSVTNGSPTVIVNETAHGLTNGSYIPVFRCGAIGGITPSGRYQVTVNNANQWQFTHGSNATSTVSNGGGNFNYGMDYYSGAYQHPVLNNAFNTTNGSPDVTVQLPSGGNGGTLRANGYINFYGASTIGGLDVNGRQKIYTDSSGGLITIRPGGNANATVANGGGTNVCYVDEWMWPRVPQNSQIAVSTPTNWVMIGAAGRGIFYTTNGGANPTWTRCSFPSPVNETQGAFDWGYNSYRSIVVADPNTANKFYLFHYDNGTYVSTDSGANWTLQSSNTLAGGNFHAKLRCVPGFSGHLFWASGHIGTYNDYGSPTAKNYFSTNGGVTWTEIGSPTLGAASTGEVVELYDLSIGAIKPGKTYPTIWAVGWINGVYGIYYCVDFDPTVSGKPSTWYKAGDYPLGSIDYVQTMCADPDQWDTCYIGFSGSGAVYTAANTTVKTFKIKS
jgi:hypothetical protein